jgi:hypothetical protein
VGITPPSQNERSGERILRICLGSNTDSIFLRSFMDLESIFLQFEMLNVKHILLIYIIFTIVEIGTYISFIIASHASHYINKLLLKS